MEGLKGKFVHQSIRIPAEVRSELESEAKGRKINFNSLTNQILARHLSFDRITEHVGTIPLNGPLFLGMLNSCPLEVLEAIGKETGPKIVKRTFKLLGIEYDIEGLIENYFEPLSTYSRWYTFKSVGKGPNRKLFFEHPYGKNWSIFLKSYLSGIVREATGYDPRIVCEDDLITISFAK